VGFQGADLILGFEGNDVLMGDLGNDTLLGGDGNDIIIGGDGDDLIYGENGNDVLEGGSGNDYIDGGSGDDTFIYGRGSGNDTIQRYSSWSGNSNGIDTVQFGEGLTADSFEYYGRGLNEGGDLVLTIKDTGETLTIKNWFSDNQYRVDSFLFSGGIEMTAEDISARAEILPIIGTEEDDILNGVAVPDHNNTLYGLGGNDNLSGENRDDILDGGMGDDTLSGVDGNDTLIGGAGNDYLYGYSGNDMLDGGLGNDYMSGSCGDDNYIVDSMNDIITEAANEGIDTVQTSITYTLGNNFENLTLIGSAIINGTGNALDNIITGNISNNILNGGAGKDTMIGGSGNDTFVVNSMDDVIIENSGEGTDLIQSSVTYTLGPNLENLTLTGSSSINGTGNELNNILIGNSAANSLTGGAGNDTIDGKAGADIMLGGIGNDTYTVDNAGDIVTEFIDEGADTVKSSVTYTLAANIENLTLTGSSAIKGTGNSLNNIITGNSAANILTSGDGNDTLNGGAGADTLAGGTDNDTYYVDNAGDIIVEYFNEGTDAVNSSITYAIGSNIENLTLTGSYAINGTGNELGNILTGNSTVNTLTGGAGNDTIDGKAGADIMAGGIGDDTYTIDNIGDVVTEYTNEGIDTVKSSITYSLGDNVENLTLTGTTAIKGTGNSMSNTLTGNSAANTLTAGAGNDILNGGAGVDTLIGGTGNDTYFVDNTGDIVTEYINEGADTVNSSVTYTLGADLENLTLTGNGATKGTGNTLDNIIVGNSGTNILTGNNGNDLLDGNWGNDTLTGGNGSDKYIFRRTDGKDTVNETAGLDGDNDTVKMTDGIAATEPVIVKHNNDLYLFVDSSNYIRMTNQFYQPNYGMERLEVSDGCYITRQDINNIINTMITINSDPGMDVIQKFNAMRNDQLYINTLAQSWHQPQA
jgi:Ca2+-binding RTX toxin-like protein